MDPNIEHNLTRLNLGTLLTYITTIGNYVGLKIPVNVAFGIDIALMPPMQKISPDGILQDGHNSQASSLSNDSVLAGRTSVDCVETPPSSVVVPASLRNEGRISDQPGMQKSSTQNPTPIPSSMPSQYDLRIGMMTRSDCDDQFIGSLWNGFPPVVSYLLSDYTLQDQIARAEHSQLQNDVLPKNLVPQIPRSSQFSKDRNCTAPAVGDESI